MVEAAAISDLFSLVAGPGRKKLLVFGPPSDPVDPLVNRSCSLNFEHVSPSDLIKQEISRRTPVGLAAQRCIQNGQAMLEETLLSVMKRWFWTRKPDAGFALTGFPATLLQAKIFDEWLDSRGEILDGIVTAGPKENPIIDYYRTLGLLTQIELPLPK